jgi:hypothetical protein
VIKYQSSHFALEREALESERKMIREVAFQVKNIRLFYTHALSHGIYPIPLNEIASFSICKL